MRVGILKIPNAKSVADKSSRSNASKRNSWNISVADFTINHHAGTSCFVPQLPEDKWPWSIVRYWQFHWRKRDVKPDTILKLSVNYSCLRLWTCHPRALALAVLLASWPGCPHALALGMAVHTQLAQATDNSEMLQLAQKLLYLYFVFWTNFK